MTNADEDMGYDIRVSAGYEYRFSVLSLTPYSRLSYARANIAAYSETAPDPNALGSGSVLHIDNQTVKSMVLGSEGTSHAATVFRTGAGIRG